MYVAKAGKWEAEHKKEFFALLCHARNEREKYFSFSIRERKRNGKKWSSLAQEARVRRLTNFHSSSTAFWLVCLLLRQGQITDKICYSKGCVTRLAGSPDARYSLSESRPMGTHTRPLYAQVFKKVRTKSRINPSLKGEYRPLYIQTD